MGEDLSESGGTEWKTDLYFSRERWGFTKWNLKSLRAVELPTVSATAAWAASFHSIRFSLEPLCLACPHCCSCHPSWVLFDFGLSRVIRAGKADRCPLSTYVPV